MTYFLARHNLYIEGIPCYSMLEDIFNGSIGDLIEKCDSIKADTTIKEFIKILNEKKIDFIPVVDAEEKVIGMATAKDLIKLIKIKSPEGGSIIAKEIQKDALSQPVTKIMTQNPVTIKESSSIGDVLNLIAIYEFRRIIVVSPDNRLVGFIGIRDVIKKLVE